MHLAACELLSERKPEYDPRRLEALAHPIAFVMLIQKDVENLGDSSIKKLFVDVFTDRKSFFDLYASELDKADQVIMSLARSYKQPVSISEDYEDHSANDGVDIDS